MICTGECKCADYQVGKTSPPEILTAGFSGSESRRGYTGGRVPLPPLPTSGAHSLQHNCYYVTIKLKQNGYGTLK